MVKTKNKIQILFFVSSMILSVQALEINLLNILRDFKCKTDIEINPTAYGYKEYAKMSLRPMYYWASEKTSTVIAYIVDVSRFEEIANANALKVRMEIAKELKRNDHEIVFLGIKICKVIEFDLISSIIFDIIKPHPTQMPLKIVTMGEQTFNRTYIHNKLPIEQYQENANICSGALQHFLIMAFPKMEYRSKRPDPSHIKEVLVYENLEYSRHNYGNETRWPILVKNGVYIPAPTIVPFLNTMRYNLIRRCKNSNKIHILVVSGKDYNLLTSDNHFIENYNNGEAAVQYASAWFKELKQIMNEMSRKDETLLIMACFNFDWSEIDIVPQIILKHSEIRAKDAYNVFTIGIGMFDTFYQNLNKDDERCLPPTTNEKVIEFVSGYSGENMRDKTIEIYDFYQSSVTMIPIRLINGRYVPRREFKNYCFSSKHPNAEFAFIVMDSSEMYRHDAFSAAQLNQNASVVVFIIKANNFKLYDLHIIPEWIQWHRGTVHPDRIAILGGGSFDTTFKYVSPQYEATYTLLDVAKDLKTVRETFVHTTKEKAVIVANIDTSKFEYCRFPMHTINGFYDPVVLSTNEMFHTDGKTKILFLIMKANKFMHMATAFPTMAPQLITDLRERLASHYPFKQWAVHLVGLEKFGRKDFHLFAEFVKMHTHDGRPLREFVFTFGDDIYQSAYTYRDTLPLYTAHYMPMADAFIDFFRTIEKFPNLDD